LFSQLELPCVFIVTR